MMELLFGMGALLVLAAMAGGFAFGYRKVLKRVPKDAVPTSQDYALAVLIGMVCAVGVLLLIAGLLFGACVCMVSQMSLH